MAVLTEAVQEHERRAELAGSRVAARLVFVSPADPAAVYAITGGRVGRSRIGSSGARTAAVIGSRPTAVWLRHISGRSRSTRRASLTVYAATGRGVLKSTDGGEHWRERVSRQEVSAVAVDSRDPQTVYAGTDGGRDQEPGRRNSWRVVNTAVGSHGRDRASGRCPRSSSTRSTRRRSMRRPVAWASSGAATAVAAGAPRKPVRNPQCQDSAVALATRAPQKIYGVYGWRGVFKSSDGGVHWRTTNTGLSLMTVSSLAVDPTGHRSSTRAPGSSASSRAATEGTTGDRSHADSSTQSHSTRATPGSSSPAEAHNRVLRSTDAGRTWQPTEAGVAMTPLRSRSAATTPTRQRSRAASTPATTVDAAGMSLPVPSTARRALAIAPDDPAVVYASAGGSDARGLYKSTDAGRSWQRLTDRPEDAGISALTLDPEHATTLYVGTGDKGVFKSTDGGAGWQPASSGLPRVTMKGTTVTGKATSWRETVGIAALAIDPETRKRSTQRRADEESSEARTLDRAGIPSTPEWPSWTSGRRNRRDRSDALRRQGQRRRHRVPCWYQLRTPMAVTAPPRPPDASPPGRDRAG